MTPQRRQPAGVPMGGQFAATQHAESTITLESPAHPLAVAPADPMDFHWMHNTVSSTAHIADQTVYGRDVEPAGRYITEGNNQNGLEGWESGVQHFDRPLHIDFGGQYDDDSNWKRRLSDYYDGKTGAELSRAVIADGFDAIITRDGYGSSETVDLTGVVR